MCPGHRRYYQEDQVLPLVEMLISTTSLPEEELVAFSVSGTVRLLVLAAPPFMLTLPVGTAACPPDGGGEGGGVPGVPR